MQLRHFSLWCSFMHANLVLLLVPVAVAMQCLPMLQDDKDTASWAERLWALRLELNETAPTFLHAVIAAMAGSYYVFDFLTLWGNVHPLSLTLKLWYTVHHVFCFAGLTMPVFYTPNSLDTTLAFIGFWFGEVSNPPRCVVDLLQAAIDTANDKMPAGSAPVKQVRVLCQSHSVKSLQSLMDSLQQIHLALFVAFRVVGTHYFLAVCWPYAALDITLVSGGVTLALSLMAVVVMLQPKPKEGAAAVTPKVEAKANGKKAN